MDDLGEVMAHSYIFCPVYESVFFMAYLRKLLSAFTDWWIYWHSFQLANKYVVKYQEDVLNLKLHWMA